MKLNPNQSWGNFLKAAKYYSSTPAKEDYIARSKLGLSDFEIIMCNGDYKEALKILLEKIEKAPAADVVEVVRCKDCKYYYAWPDDYRTCHKHYQIDGSTAIIGAMGFCSDAIRRKDDNG